MSARPVLSPEVTEPVSCYSQGMVVPAGSTLVFASGAASRDLSGAVVGKGDIGQQTEKALDNLTAVLAAAGATLADVVKVTVFVLEIGSFEAVQEVRRRYFKPPYPASSLVEVSALADPDMLVEIEAIAALPP